MVSKYEPFPCSGCLAYVEGREVEANGLVACAVDKDVLKQNVLGVNHRHGPHLGIQEADTLEGAILGARNSNLVRTTGIIVGTVDKSVPHLSTAIESSVTMAFPVDALSTKQPSARLVLIADRE